MSPLLLVVALAAAAPLTESVAIVQALEGNPDLAVLRARVSAAKLRADVVQRRPDLEVAYEQRGVPIGRPWGLDEADMLMLGVRQPFLPPGLTDARVRAAGAEASSVGAGIAAKEEEIAAAVHEAFAEFARSDDEALVHDEHISLASNLTESARALAAAGRVAIEDVVRIGAEMARLHAEQLAVARRKEAATVRLNWLLGRPLTTPLGDVQPDDLATLLARAEKAKAAGTTARPELEAGRRLIALKAAEVEVMRLDATQPMFMAGLDYAYMPMGMVNHGYNAMVSMTLPWLNPGSDAPARQAAAERDAEELALAATVRAVDAELAEAVTWFDSSRESLQSLDEDVLPKERQALEVSRGAYSAGSGRLLDVLDALRTNADVRLERARAMALLRSTVVRLERAAGVARGAKEQAP